jgi:hypothetical protein
MLDSRLKWLIRNGVITGCMLLLWNTVLIRSLKILAAFAHEFFHALTALLTGGGVQKIEITSFGSGYTVLEGGSPVIVYSAGYIGTAVLGSVMLATGLRYAFRRTVYLIVSLLILGTTVLFVRNPFGMAYGVTAGILFLIFLFKEFWFSHIFTELVGIMLITTVLYDCINLFRFDFRNDASILHDLTGISFTFIVASWIAATIIMLSIAIFFSVKNSTFDEVLYQKRRTLILKKIKGFLGRFFSAKGRDKKMHEKEGLSVDKRTKRTLIVYFSIIGAIALLVVYVSRYVLFHPWTERDWLSAAAVKGKIYTGGGRDSRRLLKDDILMIDPVKLSIRDIGSLPSPRFGTGAAGIFRNVVFIGGFDNADCIDEIVLLDTVTKEVRTIGHLPGPRAFGATVEYSGRIYYLGGWDGKNTIDEIVSVDPVTGESSIVGRLSSPREYTAAAVISDKIYLIGGSDQNGNYLDEMLTIDPNAGKVLKKESIPIKRIRSSTAVFRGNIYLFGGWEGKKIDEIWFFDPKSGAREFKVFAHLPRGFSDTAAVTLDNQLYLIGGVDERFHRQISVIRVDPESGKDESLKFRSFFIW